MPFRPLTKLPLRATLVLSTDPDRSGGDLDTDDLVLEPSEAVLLRLEPPGHGESPAG